MLNDIQQAQNQLNHDREQANQIRAKLDQLRAQHAEQEAKEKARLNQARARRRQAENKLKKQAAQAERRHRTHILIQLGAILAHNQNIDEIEQLLQGAANYCNTHTHDGRTIRELFWEQARHHN